MCLTILILTSFVLSYANKSITLTKNELASIHLIDKIQELVHLFTLKREIQDTQSKNNSLERINVFDKKIENIKEYISNNTMIRQMPNTYKHVNIEINFLEDILTKENQKKYELAILSFLNVISQIGRESMLELDPNHDSTLLISIVIKDGLNLFRNLVTLKNFGIQQRDSNNKQTLNTITNNINSEINTFYDEILYNLSEIEKNYKTRTDLHNKFNNSRNIAYMYLKNLQEESEFQGPTILDTNNNFDTSSTLIGSFHLFYSSIIKEIDILLRQRIADTVRDRNLKLYISLLFTSLAILIAFVTKRYITKQIGAINDVFYKIEEGDFTARVNIVSMDELGDMAVSLNGMLNRIFSLVQSQEERDSIQDSIMKLLDEVSEVAHGDLTVQAEVTEDVTGAIADSFNNMIHQLRQIVVNVQNATIQVGTSANQIQLVAENLADGSSSQAERIVDSSAALDEIVASIQQVSEHATLSANVAQQSLANAKQGALAVRNTIEGMQRIRSQVQETAKRIKRLGERSQEIGEIVQLIGDIADRTSILALNASIQAARAGEAGRSFAVVAEEVERLAERSTSATKQISSLVNAIRNETNEAVTAMEESTYEVVKGSEVADQAGQALGEIENVSSRLAELIQSISLAASQQANGSEGLSKAMGEISEVTQHTASGTKHAAEEIRHLAVLADELRNSVSTFRLP